MANKQLDTIMKHLNTLGSISTLDAINHYQIMSLSRRICDLKERGYDIVSERKTHKATKKRYVRYHLVKETV
jgi:hypothetical protein